MEVDESKHFQFVLSDEYPGWLPHNCFQYRARLYAYFPMLDLTTNFRSDKFPPLLCDVCKTQPAH